MLSTSTHTRGFRSHLRGPSVLARVFFQYNRGAPALARGLFARIRGPPAEIHHGHQAFPNMVSSAPLLDVSVNKP